MCAGKGKGAGQVQCEINRTNEATGKPRQGHTHKHTQADNKRDNEDSASGADESSTGSRGSSCFGELLWL